MMINNHRLYYKACDIPEPHFLLTFLGWIYRMFLLLTARLNSPFYPRVSYAIIKRDVTAGVHSCAILGYFTIVTYGISQCIREHAASALFCVTYFSEIA